MATSADAIASAPRSPSLNDLAIARVARSLVKVERAIRDATPSIRIKAADTANAAMNRVSDAIRAEKYALSYDLLGSLRQDARSESNVNRCEKRTLNKPLSTVRGPATVAV